MPDSSILTPDPPSDEVDQRRPSRRKLTLVAVPIIGLIIVSNVGDALAPQLVNSHPLQLLAMNARNRNLILVTNNLDALSYYLVGTLRLVLADPLFFLLGYWYGDTAIQWMESRTKTFGSTLRSLERWFSKAAYPLLFLAPNNYICLFAGAAGMSLFGFFAVNISGTVVRLYLIRRLGEAFEAPIDGLLDLIKEYRIPLLIFSVAVFAVSMVSELRREGAGLEELAEVAETADAATETADTADDPET